MTPEKPVRLLLVDDHFFVREGLSSSLGAESDIEIVGEAAGVAEAMSLVRETSPDLMLLDGELADGHGREVLEALGAEGLTTRVIVLSVDTAEESVHLAMEKGAGGYLPKTSSRKELLMAIRRVAGGGIYLTEELKAVLRRRRVLPNLTDRELTVLKRVAAGDPNKLIAASLGISETTVKVHLSRVFDKLDVQDRTSATTVALQRGLIRLE